MKFKLSIFGTVFFALFLPAFCDVQCLPDISCRKQRDCTKSANTFDISKWVSAKDGSCSICSENLKEFPRNCNEKVTCIVLHYTCLESILSEHLRQYTDLQHLTLDSNQLRYLGPSLFRHNEKLGKLKINHEQLNGTISEDVFRYATRLQHLELVDNQIGDLPLSIFDDVINLTHLYLSWNALTEIKPWKIGNVIELSAANNRLTSWPVGFELSHLRSLDLSYNRLETWVSITMTSLHKLLLRGNKIKKIDQHAFQMNRNLRILDLSNNDIEQLPENVFENLCDLTSLNLSGNKIKTIHITWFGNLIQNCQADVKIKLPQCDCRQSELKTFLRSIENHNQKNPSCKNNFEIFCSDKNSMLQDSDISCPDSHTPDVEKYYSSECSAIPSARRASALGEIKTDSLALICAFGVGALILLISIIMATCARCRKNKKTKRKSKSSECLEDIERPLPGGDEGPMIPANNVHINRQFNAAPHQQVTDNLIHAYLDPNETTPKQVYVSEHTIADRNRNRFQPMSDVVGTLYGYFNVQTSARYNPRS